MKRQQRYKYLSKSILLEESGLPHIQQLTILTITAIIVLLIIWSNYMTVDDKISVNGYVDKDLFNPYGFEFIAVVPSKNIAAIQLSDPTNLTITGVTNKTPLQGKVVKINKKPQLDQSGRTYYELTIVPIGNQNTMAHIKPVLYDKMETRVEIIVGSRTLLQYFLGPLWDTATTSNY